MSAHEYMFLDKSSLIGGSAVGIPGEIYGFWEAYKIGGRIPWKELFKPTIDMCRNGFSVSNALAAAIKSAENDIRKNLELTNIFINSSNNETFKPKDRIKMLKLADTLEIISNENVGAFYNGSLTKLMVQEINENGGNVQLEDFNNYKAIVKQPIVVDLDENFKLVTPPLPSSGILVSLILRIMKGFNVTSETFKKKETEYIYYHRLIESFKHSFYHRSLLGDERHENMEKVFELKVIKN